MQHFFLGQTLSETPPFLFTETFENGVHADPPLERYRQDPGDESSQLCSDMANVYSSRQTQEFLYSRRKILIHEGSNTLLPKAKESPESNRQDTNGPVTANPMRGNG